MSSSWMKSWGHSTLIIQFGAIFEREVAILLTNHTDKPEICSSPYLAIVLARSPNIITAMPNSSAGMLASDATGLHSYEAHVFRLSNTSFWSRRTTFSFMAQWRWGIVFILRIYRYLVYTKYSRINTTYFTPLQGKAGCTPRSTIRERITTVVFVECIMLSEANIRPSSSYPKSAGTLDIDIANLAPFAYSSLLIDRQLSVNPANSCSSPPSN